MQYTQNQKISEDKLNKRCIGDSLYENPNKIKMRLSDLTYAYYCCRFQNIEIIHKKCVSFFMKDYFQTTCVNDISLILELTLNLWSKP